MFRNGLIEFDLLGHNIQLAVTEEALEPQGETPPGTDAVPVYDATGFRDEDDLIKGLADRFGLTLHRGVYCPHGCETAEPCLFMRNES